LKNAKQQAYFKRYCSIENHTFKDILEAISLSGFTAQHVKWVATEKVHGANFSFCYDGKEIRCFKRSGLVKDEFFHGHAQVQKDLEPNIKKAYEMVRQLVSDVNVIHIFGELFGGGYPHPSLKPLEGVKHVQKYIWYSQSVSFFAFDISTDTRGYLDFDVAEAIFKNCNFFYSLPLITGTFDEVMKFDVETFETTIPGRLSLPPINNNLAEGVVIKPIQNRSFAKFRLMLKKKRSTLAETLNMVPKQMKPPKIVPISSDLPPNVAALLPDAFRYVTENRLRSVISKVGPKNSSVARLTGLFVKDVITDYRKENPTQFDTLEGAAKKAFSAQITHRAQEMISTNFEAIISSEF